MTNLMDIAGFRAVIQYDADIGMFRGEFIDLNGGADFYATDVAGLREEAQKSLQVFLDMCREDGVEPRRQYSGSLVVQVAPELHADITAAARGEGKSVTAWIETALQRQLMQQQ